MFSSANKLLSPCAPALRRWSRVLLAVAAAVILPSATRAASSTDSNPDPEWTSTDFCLRDWIIQSEADDFYTRFLYYRLELGLRSQYVRLLDRSTDQFDENGEFIGGFGEGISVDSLEERQTVWPNMFGRYRLNPYAAIEISWENLSADANTFWDGHRDGIVSIGGPAFLMMGRYPNETRYTPFIAGGLALLNASFSPNQDWHEGPGYTRNISVDDTVGFVFSGGCDVKMKHRTSLNLTLRYMQADVDANYQIEWGDGRITNRRAFDFPLSSLALEFGVVYAF